MSEGARHAPAQSQRPHGEQRAALEELAHVDGSCVVAGEAKEPPVEGLVGAEGGAPQTGARPRAGRRVEHYESECARLAGRDIDDHPMHPGGHDGLGDQDGDAESFRLNHG